MRTTLLTVALLACLVVGEAQGYEAGCTQPLPECTKARVAHLKAQGKALSAAARQKPGQPLNSEERALVDRYDHWLKAQSRKVLDLADRGGVSTTPETQQSFNQQYLQLQSQMQKDNRAYSAGSDVEIVKTKHDIVQKSLSNAH